MFAIARAGGPGIYAQKVQMVLPTGINSFIRAPNHMCMLVKTASQFAQVTIGVGEIYE